MHLLPSMLVLIAAAALSFLTTVQSIYADQVGEVDFHLELIGQPVEGASIVVDDYFYIPTDRGVLACFQASSGKMLWRSMVDSKPIQSLILVNSDLLVTLSHDGTILRAWNSATGFLRWDIFLPQTTTAGSSDQTVDVAFVASSNSIHVLSNNKIYFLDTSGNILRQFTPLDSYAASSLKVISTKREVSLGTGAFILILSGLTHPSATMLTSSSPIVAVGCFVSSSSPDICVLTALLKFNSLLGIFEVLTYPGLPVSPEAIHSNIFTDEDLADQSSVFALEQTPTTTALHLIDVSSKHAGMKLSFPIAGAGPTFKIATFTLAAAESIESSTSHGFVGLTVCSPAGNCSAYVYSSSDSDGADRSPKSLFSFNSCFAKEGDTAAMGPYRSTHHPSLVHSVSCAQPSPSSNGGSVSLMTSSLSSSREISSIELTIALPHEAGSTGFVTLSGGAGTALQTVLSTSSGQILLTVGARIVAVREESLAYIQQALILKAPHDAVAFDSRHIPSFEKRLTLQWEAAKHMVMSIAELGMTVLSVLETTSVMDILAGLLRGKYNFHRSNDVLFGFNKIAVCLTSFTSSNPLQTSLHIVGVDLLNKGNVVFSISPELPSNIGRIISMKLYKLDGLDERLVLIVTAFSGTVYFYEFRVLDLLKKRLTSLPLSASIVDAHLETVNFLETKSSAEGLQYALVRMTN